MRIWVGLTLLVTACSLVDLDDLDRGDGSTSTSTTGTGTTAAGSTSTAAAVTASTSGTTASSGSGGAPDAYYVAVVDAQPMAYYRFDDDPDSLTIHDEMGDHAMKYTGAQGRRVAGGFPGSKWAVHFDGQSRGELPPGFEFAGTAEFSIELWFRVASTASLQFVFANDTGVAPTRRGYVIVTYDDASVGIERWGFDPQNNNVAPGARSAADAVVPGAWHHLVATWDGDVHALYLDGVAGTSHGIVIELPDDGLPGYLGADGDGNAHFEGEVDELAIYPIALSEDVVREHFVLAGGT